MCAAAAEAWRRALLANILGTRSSQRVVISSDADFKYSGSLDFEFAGYCIVEVGGDSGTEEMDFVIAAARDRSLFIRL